MKRAYQLFLSACVLYTTVIGGSYAAELTESNTNLVNVPKHLATIGMSNGLVATFRTDRDGVVYEETGPHNVVGRLRDKSILERFLLLTETDVGVPQDLVTIDERRETVNMARQRARVQRHQGVIVSNKYFDSGQTNNGNEFIPAFCNLNPTVFDNDENGTYTVMFHNYPWGPSGPNVYSSWKSGADKAKTVQMHLINCSEFNIINANTHYKNIFGVYKKQDNINVFPTDSHFFSKTYTSKRRRLVTINGFGPGSVSGFVSFSNY